MVENEPVASSSLGETRDVKPALKKKRKQLVACDGCRLRRVKCDKADMNDGDCSECIKKSLKCTDNYIKNKPKVVRSGKLIEKARVLYGDGGVVAQSTTAQQTSSGQSPVSAEGSSDGGRRSQTSSSGPKVNTALIRASHARFENVELARAISNHLINIYHDMVHIQTPIFDFDHFSRNWEAAGQNTENMSPTGECAALVMQAWAARFSDHPSIVGEKAPSLAELKASPIRNYSQYGQVRDSFARAMADRAIRMVDKRGALRKASGQSAAALMMLEFLITWGDTTRSQGRHMMVAAIEHLRSLNDGITDDPTEDPNIQHRTAGGTVFWMAYTRDALSAAFGGRSTCLSDDDIALMCEIAVMPVTANVEHFVNSNDPRTLCGLAVVSIFRHITNVIRAYTVRVGGPLPRRTRLCEASVRSVWNGIEQSADYAAQFRVAIDATVWPTPPKSAVWFRDLGAMRAQVCHALHRNIVERLEMEERAAIGVDDPNLQVYLDRLRAIRDESSLRFLFVSREVAKMTSDYGTNLIFETGTSCENLPSYLEHMLSVPAWEQGGPENWTAASKIEESLWLIDSIKLQGYCWPDFNRRIEYATRVIDTLSAQVQLAAQNAYANPQPSARQTTRSPQQQYADSIALQQQQQLRGPLNSQLYGATSSAATQSWIPPTTTYDYPVEQEGMQYYDPNGATYDANNPLANLPTQHTFYPTQETGFHPQYPTQSYAS